MKNKIKKHTKKFVDYTLTNEFKRMVMLLLFTFSMYGIFLAIISNAVVNDTTKALKVQQEKYEELKSKYETLEVSCLNQKIWADELYDLFTTCQESTSWYEQFYYDNVSPYTGTIEGEYHE